MAIRRCEDGWFQICAKIVPKLVRSVQLAVPVLVQIVLKAVWFGGVKETEYAALILSKSPPRDRSEHTSNDGMQWPACFQHHGEPCRVTSAFPACETGDGGRERAGLLWTMITLNSA